MQSPYNDGKLAHVAMKLSTNIERKLPIRNSFGGFLMLLSLSAFPYSFISIRNNNKAIDIIVIVTIVVIVTVVVHGSEVIVSILIPITNCYVDSTNVQNI